ncbi:MAG: hypothetical protein VKJ02_13920 [Snowella sp.]|nr:hypothetical protein [Snowella sp.]
MTHLAIAINQMLEIGRRSLTGQIRVVAINLMALRNFTELKELFCC